MTLSALSASPSLRFRGPDSSKGRSARDEGIHYIPRERLRAFRNSERCFPPTSALRPDLDSTAASAQFVWRPEQSHAFPDRDVRGQSVPARSDSLRSTPGAKLFHRHSNAFVAGKIRLTQTTR